MTAFSDPEVMAALQDGNYQFYCLVPSFFCSSSFIFFIVTCLSLHG